MEQKKGNDIHGATSLNTFVGGMVKNCGFGRLAVLLRMVSVHTKSSRQVALLPCLNELPFSCMVENRFLGSHLH